MEGYSNGSGTCSDNYMCRHVSNVITILLLTQPKEMGKY